MSTGQIPPGTSPDRSWAAAACPASRAEQPRERCHLGGGALVSPGMCRPLCGLEPCQGHGDLPVAGRASCLSCRQRWTWLTPPPSWNRPPGFWDTSFRGSSRPEVATSQAPPEASGLSGPLPSPHGAPGALRLLGRMEGERLRGLPAVTLSSRGPGSATSRARHSGGPAMTSAPPSPPCRLVPTRSQRTFRNDFNGGGTHERDALFWPFRVFA